MRLQNVKDLKKNGLYYYNDEMCIPYTDGKDNFLVGLTTNSRYLISEIYSKEAHPYIESEMDEYAAEMCLILAKGLYSIRFETPLELVEDIFAEFCQVCRSVIENKQDLDDIIIPYHNVREVLREYLFMHEDFINIFPISTYGND